MEGVRLQNITMAQSVAAKKYSSNLPERGISKVTWQKLRDNAVNKTEFYDISQQSKLLPELKTRSAVHPQLETVDFYKGGRISDVDYIPQTSKSYHNRKFEHGIGYRKFIPLECILENFNEGQISFVGQAGSGKTTLLKAITRQVIEGEYNNLSSIEIVHFVHLRTFNRNDLVTPAELLFRNVTPEMSDAEMTDAMQYAKKNPDKVLFVIDSLDTVPYTIDAVYTGIATDDRASPEAILFHLLSGNLIPGCRFITSSREYAIRNYKGDVRAKQVIALAGLVKESMRKIVVGYVGEEKAEKKMTYLTQKPVIESLCATPVWLIFTLMVLSIKSKFTPTTMAGILVVLLQNMIRSEHVREKNIEVVVGKLGKMAFTGTKEHRVEFSLNELGNFSLLESEIRDLMLATPSGGYQKLIFGDAVLMYAHQCLQEILSAFHIAKLNLIEFKEFISMYIHKPHYAVVRRLLAGILLNNMVFEEAKNFLEDASDFKKKKLYLMKSLNNQLERYLKQNHKEDRLELYMCFSETSDGPKDLVRNRAHKFSKIESLSPSEMYSIGWIMSWQTSIKILNLRQCNLSQALLSVLYHALEGSNVQLDELDISNNKSLGPDEMIFVAKICVLSKLKILKLRGCQPTSEALKVFLDSSISAKLDELDVSGNTLGADEMMVIAEICKQHEVDRLRVRRCRFLSGALKSFLLNSVGAKFAELDVSRNTFQADDMMVIAEICRQRQVDIFRVGCCKFLSGALKAFLLHSVGAKISMLYISCVKLEEHDQTLLGRIIRQCGVDTLGAAKPEDLGFIDVEDFKISSDNFKLCKLEIVNSTRYFHFEVDAICKFLPYVAKEVILTNNSIKQRELDILQNKLDEGRSRNLKIIFEKGILYRDNVRLDINRMILECSKSIATNSPSIVKDRRAKLNSDGGITVSWDYPDEDPDVRYHVETFCNDQPTGDMEICKDAHYESKSPRPSIVYCFRIWVVDSVGNVGIGMFTNEVMSRPSLVKNVRMDIVGKISNTQSESDLSSSGTKCTNPLLSSSGAIAEPFVAEISSEGGNIKLSGCKIIFKRGAFKSATKVIGKAEIDRNKWPTHYVGVTSMLYINTENDLLIPATLNMTTWCTCDQSQKATTVAHVLHYCEQTSTWDVIKELPLGSDNTFQFECHDFSPIIVAIPNESFNSSLVSIDGAIYANRKNNFILAFHPRHPQLKEEVRKDMAEFDSRVQMRFGTFIIKAQERVGAFVDCVDPTDFIFRPSSVFEFSVLKDCNNSQIFQKNLCLRRENDSPYCGRIEMTSSIQKDGEVLDGPHNFFYDWEPLPVAGDETQARSDPVSYPTSSRTYHPEKGTKRNHEGVPVVHATQQVFADVSPEQMSVNISQLSENHYQSHNGRTRTPIKAAEEQDFQNWQQYPNFPESGSSVVPSHTSQSLDELQHEVYFAEGLGTFTDIIGTVGGVPVHHATQQVLADVSPEQIKNIHARGNCYQSENRQSQIASGAVGEQVLKNRRQDLNFPGGSSVVPSHTPSQSQVEIPRDMQQTHSFPEGTRLFPGMTAAQIRAGQPYSLPNPHQPSSSMHVPPSFTDMPGRGQLQQYSYYGGAGGSFVVPSHTPSQSRGEIPRAMQQQHYFPEGTRHFPGMTAAQVRARQPYSLPNPYQSLSSMHVPPTYTEMMSRGQFQQYHFHGGLGTDVHQHNQLMDMGHLRHIFPKPDDHLTRGQELQTAPTAGAYRVNIQGISDPLCPPTSSNKYIPMEGSRRGCEVKKIHPRKSRYQSDNRRSQIASGAGGEQVFKNRQQHLNILGGSYVDPSHTSSQSQGERPYEMQHKVSFPEASGTFPGITAAQVRAKQLYSLPNPHQPSSSMYVPPTTPTEVMARGQYHSYGGPGISAHKSHEQRHMGYHPISAASEDHLTRGRELEIASKAALGVEKTRPAFPPVIKEPTLKTEDTKVCASWDKVKDEHVTYCIDLYCNAQKQKTEPYKTPATNKEFHQLQPSSEYRCVVWATNSCGIDGGKTWSNAVKTQKDIKPKLNQSSLPGTLGTPGSFNINVHGDVIDQRRYHNEHVMAQNYANHGSEIASTQTGTNFRMSEQIESSSRLVMDLTATDDENEKTDSEL